MRALAAALAPLAHDHPRARSSPDVEAALKVFQVVGTDGERLKAFCELMHVDEQLAEKADPILEAKLRPSPVGMIRISRFLGVLGMVPLIRRDDDAMRITAVGTKKGY